MIHDDSFQNQVQVKINLAPKWHASSLRQTFVDLEPRVDHSHIPQKATVGTNPPCQVLSEAIEKHPGAFKDKMAFLDRACSTPETFRMVTDGHFSGF